MTHSLICIQYLETACLKLKEEKCKLFSKSVSFLGHIISVSEIETDLEKIQAVTEWPIPVNVTEINIRNEFF